MTLRICYGGTFDPVHAGHLAVAAAARATFATTIHFVPAADPPHRSRPGASAGQRAAMLDLAIAGEPDFVVDRRELNRDGPSWTVATLEDLRSELGPDQPLAWLVGADAFRGLPAWHRWRELPGLAHVIVAVRPGHGLEPLPPELALACADRWTTSPGDLAAAPAGRVFALDMPPHPASATELRCRLLAGLDPGDWLPAGVAAFIARHRLYTGDTPPAGV